MERDRLKNANLKNEEIVVRTEALRKAEAVLKYYEENIAKFPTRKVKLEYREMSSSVLALVDIPIADLVRFTREQYHQEKRELERVESEFNAI